MAVFNDAPAPLAFLGKKQQGSLVANGDIGDGEGRVGRLYFIHFLNYG